MTDDRNGQRPDPLPIKAEAAVLKVTHFSRRPASGAFSIERVFADIRGASPPHVEIVERRNAHLSKGVIPRLRDALAARRHVSAVNHVTGDVHYLTYFLPRDRTVLTVHDTIMIERAGGLKRALLLLFWFWLPARRAGWMTAISSESKRRLLKLVAFDPDRIVVIPNPVSINFSTSPPPFREGPVRLLHIGTKSNKNLERVIPALEGLDVELTVIGQMTEAQTALLHRHDVAHRTRQGLDDVALRAEYARAEVIVFVSLEEGFGLPIIEAQASGRPVITAARAPMDEVAGNAALLVDPEDIEEIRAAVIQIIESSELRAELVAKGKKNVEQYSATTIARKYADLYTQIDRATGNNPSIPIVEKASR